VKREKRISNIEQGISNDEVRNTGALPNWVPVYNIQGFGFGVAEIS
jgi:hypothetical protein